MSIIIQHVCCLPLFGVGMSPVELLFRCHATSAFAAARQKANIKSSIIAIPDAFAQNNGHPASTIFLFVLHFIVKLL
jgi:hypothetical protein